MATAPKPAAPASAPAATKTSVWKSIFGGGSVDAAATELETRKKKIDDEENKAVRGYKNGGLVKSTAKATPYKCGGKVK